MRRAPVRDLVVELVVQILFEVLAGAAQWFFEYLVDVDFEGNRGRLAGDSRAKLGWYAVAGAAAGGASAVVHAAPLSMSLAMRVAGLVLIPIASSLAVVVWDAGRGRGGDGRLRASFWAGAAFGAGYVVVRLVVVWIVRA